MLPGTAHTRYPKAMIVHQRKRQKQWLNRSIFLLRLI